MDRRRPPTARGVIDVIDHPGAERPAEPAATVLLIRDSIDSGLDVLMIRRGEVGSFGGMWAFPGGVIEREDVPHGTAPDPLPAARAAAVRETEEEVGLLLDPDGLSFWSHWLPDNDSPNRRFSTWFFLASAAAQLDSHDVTIDGAEVHDHRWITPSEVLDRHRAGELQLAPPTFVTLLQLAAHGSVHAATAASPGERFATQLVLGDDRRWCLWHGDVAYRDDPSAAAPAPADLERPGPRHRLLLAESGWRYDRDVAGS
ncbi:MAG: NUDIX hydrolase [Actinomycetota bacterium]